MKPLRNEELTVLCEQVEMILRAGLPLADSVEAISDDYRGTRWEPCFDRLTSRVNETGSLYEGFQAAGVFPEYLMEMTRIGEKTGELDGVMADLAVYYRREAQNRRAVVSAVLYPLLLVGMMAALIAVLIIQVFPVFENVFRSLGLSAASSPWIGVAIGVGRGVLIAAGALIALVLVALAALRADKSGRVRSAMFRALSPLSRLNQKLCASRFSATLAMMLRSGFPLGDSLEMIEGLLSDKELRQKVARCRAEMEAGESFAKAVEKIGLFERLPCRMIAVGFQAGQADRVMANLAEQYDEEIDEQIGKLISVIEPSLVALMCVIIGAILLSVMLPLLSIMSSMT